MNPPIKPVLTETDMRRLAAMFVTQEFKLWLQMIRYRAESIQFESLCGLMKEPEEMILRDSSQLIPPGSVKHVKRAALEIFIYQSIERLASISELNKT